MYDEQLQTKKPMDEQALRRTDLGMKRSSDKRCMYHSANRMLWRV